MLNNTYFNIEYNKPIITIIKILPLWKSNININKIKKCEKQ